MERSSEHRGRRAVAVATVLGVGALASIVAPVGVGSVSAAPPVAQLTTDVIAGPDPSYPTDAAPVGARVMWIANRTDSEREPFVYDPTTGAATLLKDVSPGPSSSEPFAPTPLGALTVFGADDGVHGDEPWVTDGTTAGTTLLKDIRDSDEFGSNAWAFTEFNGFLYFQADDGAVGSELWRTDGTPAGTTFVKDINDGEDGSAPEGFTAMGGALYFSVATPDGIELWKTDGTPTGTVPVDPSIDKPLAIGEMEIVATADRVFFTADNPDFGVPSLWITDGTAGGTRPVETAALPFSVLPENLTVADGKVYFFAEDGDTGDLSLWVSDGTDGGTVPLVDVASFVPGFAVEPLADGGVVFAGGSLATGVELWVSDGSPAGTRLLADLEPGPGVASDPYEMQLLNEWVYFVATTSANGNELWRTDGVSVERVTDLTPGAGDGVPTMTTLVMEPVGDRLYFTGQAPATGIEVWFIEDTSAPPPPPAAPAMVPVVPARLLETRVGPTEVTVDHEFEGDGPLAAGSVLALTVAGRGGVPVDASAVMLNVTAVFPSGPGYLTVFPCGEPQPLASNVNYAAGQVVPNAVLAKMGTFHTLGAVCIYTLATTDVVVDVNGYVPAGGTPSTVVPARLLETRVGPSELTVDGLFQGGGVRSAGSVLELDVTGRGGVPVDADAVMLNVTAVFPSGPGYLTVFPCGSPQPLASNVNYAAGQVVPNAVLAKVGTGGNVCIYTLTDTHVVVDVNGYVPAGGTPSTVVPARLLETRVGPSELTVDGLFQGGGVRPAGSVLELDVTGRGGVPVDADAVMLNVTAVFPSGPGYLTVFPCGSPQPLASNVNYAAGQVVPNAVLAKVGTGGNVCIYTLTDTHLIADVTGYL